jgi:antitoxin YefM
MHVISYTTARREFAKAMDDVCDNHNPVVITRGKTDPVVMISLEDFNALQETSYLLKSSNNAKRLYAGIEEVEALISKAKKKK